MIKFSKTLWYCGKDIVRQNLHRFEQANKIRKYIRQNMPSISLKMTKKLCAGFSI